MSALVSIANGNFTTAGTWCLVDATSYLDSEAGNTTLTTSYVYSAVFTPGAITIDRIAIKIASVAASPTGTITLELYNNTGSTSVTSVTLNVSDLANTSAGSAYNRGFYVFKLGSSQLLLAATDYKIGLKTSSSSQVNIYRNATAGNWSRMLGTTTTQAPASGDQLHILGEFTGAGTGNSFTVTMDNTATTSFGPTVSGGPPQGITIGSRGTMTFGTTASTNYYLKWKGVMAGFDGGTLNVGTNGAQMPSSSTAVLEMDSAVNVDTGMDWGNGFTVNIWGATKTNFRTLMTADKIATNTVISLNDTTGWAASDDLCFAATTRTSSQCEKKTISTVDSSSQVTLSAGLTNAHSGTSPTQAEVGNLTRNIKIRGITDGSLQGYINIAPLANVTIRYAEISKIGSATANKRGVDVATTTGLCDIQYCSFADSTVTGSIAFNVSSASGSNITFSNNVVYNFQSLAIQNVATTGVQVYDNNLVVRMLNAYAVIGDVGSTYTNNTFVGSGAANSTNGFSFGEYRGVIGTFSGNTIHSGSTVGILLGGGIAGGTISSLTVWRCNNLGVIMASTSSGNSRVSNVVFDNLTLFGNLTANLSLSDLGFTSPSITGCVFNNFISNGDTTFATISGIFISGIFEAIFNSADFSTVSGIKTAHTQDFNIATTATPTQIVLNNSKLGATTQVATPSNLATESYISAQRLGATAGNHKTWVGTGTVSIDTIIYNIASPSARLTPTSASLKLQSAPSLKGLKRFVSSGSSLSVSIYVRKSVSGDGAAYNGNQPRLILKKNVALGINDDTVLATASASAGAWEKLTGTTSAATDDGMFEFVVDCDGTTGWVNIDDFINDGLKYWADGLPYVSPIVESINMFAY